LQDSNLLLGLYLSAVRLLSASLDEACVLNAKHIVGPGVCDSTAMSEDVPHAQSVRSITEFSEAPWTHTCIAHLLSSVPMKWGDYTSQVGGKGVEGSLSGGLGLHEKAEDRQHSEAGILDFLQLELLHALMDTSKQQVGLANSPAPGAEAVTVIRDTP